jgi:adenylate cyclase class 2
MYEVEMKVRANHNRIRERLAEQGATSRGRLTQRDIYYNAPARDFAETDEALRVRREKREEEKESDNRAKLTYKGPLVGSISKTREERETEIEEGDVMEGILESLGFTRVAVVEKERERFTLGDCLVMLDSVLGAGEFVEVETEARKGELDTARKRVTETVESLGVDPNAEIRTSYLELLLEDGD